MKHFLIIILLVCFLVLHKAFNYGIHVFGTTIIFYIAAWIVVLAIMHELMVRLVKNRVKAIVATAITGTFLLTFGDIQDFVQQFSPYRFMYATWLLLPLFFIALGVYVWPGKSSKSSTGKIYTYLLAMLVAVSLFEIIGYLVKSSGKRSQYADAQVSFLPEKLPGPDIYYIIFDAYTSDSCLSKYWGFRNDSLADHLRNKGFYVSGNARSMYDFTPLSLLSTFGMDSLHLSKEEQKADFRNFNLQRNRFDNNPVFNTLKENGYDVRCYSVLSDSIDLNRFYPFTPDEPLHWLRRHTIERIWLNPWLMNKVRGLFQQTGRIPVPVIKAINNLHQYNNQVFREILEGRGDKPQFVFGHFFIPHAPYIYDSTGALRITENTIPLQADTLNYLEQVRYCNKLIRLMTDQLLEKSGDKIIIIQGDHGYREYGKGVDPRATLGIMNAVYFPNRNYGQLTDSFLSVNTFRLVFNNCFGGKMNLLPGR